MKFIAPFLKDARLLFFVMAITLYGALSSPTPDNPNIVEVAILGFFVFAIGFTNIAYKFFDLSFFRRQERWQIAVGVLFVYGLSVSVFVAVQQGASMTVMVRDIAGFIFLCLPVFLFPFLKTSEKRQETFMILILSVGLFFSIRVLFLDFSFFSRREELLYLANSPLVLWAALYFVLGAFVRMQYVDLFRPQHYVSIVICFAMAVMPMAAMYIDFQRASFLALMAGLLMMLAIGAFKTPLRMVVPFCLLVFIGGIFAEQVFSVIENISVKTSKVGLNMRYQEAIAVWEHMSANVFHLFFGYGWGADFASPAVGGLNVTYTHSLLSYMFLKSGLIGLGLTLIYMFFMFEKLTQLVFIKPMMGISLLWPFIIPIFLYASYKSLDYGLILTLILVVSGKNSKEQLQ